MVNEIVEVFVEFLESNNIPTALIPFIVSLFPVLELRGGMIAGLILGVPFIQAFIASFIGNMIPIPFILLFIRKIFAWMKQWKSLSKIVDKMEKRAEKKQDTMVKYKEWGLLIFVAIPLPGTGGWTGALIAALMDLRFKKSLPIIGIGVFIAGLIMSFVTYGIF